jgi:hypothetical protein
MSINVYNIKECAHTVYCIFFNWFCAIGCSDFDLFFNISRPSCVSGEGLRFKKDQILNRFFLNVSLCFLYFTIVVVQKSSK